MRETTRVINSVLLGVNVLFMTSTARPVRFGLHTRCGKEQRRGCVRKRLGNRCSRNRDGVAVRHMRQESRVYAFLFVT